MSRVRNSLLLVGTLVVGAAHCLVYCFPFEDSYITFRYAENLARGRGLVYNPGEVVEGFTSFAWTVLLAAADTVGLPLPATACALSVLFGLALLAGTALLARARSGPASSAAGSAVEPVGAWWVVAPVLVALNGTFAYYSMSGMETSLFALLVTLAVVAALGDGTRSALAAGALLGLSALARPEGLGYWGLVVLALMAHRESRRRALLVALPFVLLFVPYFLWRWSHFGYLAPNTYYAKATPSVTRFAMGLSHAEQFMTLHLFLLAPLAALVAVAKTRAADRRSRLFLVLLCGAAANVVTVGGDTFAFYRFFLPVLPVGAVAMLDGARRVRDWLERRKPMVPSTRLAAGLAAALLMAAVTAAGSWLPRKTLTGDAGESNGRRVMEVRKLNDDYFAAGRLLKELFPPETWIAVNAAGIVPYVSGLPTIDMLGLNDVHIAHVPVAPGQGSVGHEKHDAAYVLGRSPEVIIPGLPVLSKERITPHNAGPWLARWFPYLPGDEELVSDPELASRYRIVNLPAEDGRYLPLFLRRDIPVPRRP